MHEVTRNWCKVVIANQLADRLSRWLTFIGERHDVRSAFYYAKSVWKQEKLLALKFYATTSSLAIDLCTFSSRVNLLRRTIHSERFTPPIWDRSAQFFAPAGNRVRWTESICHSLRSVRSCCFIARLMVPVN